LTCWALSVGGFAEAFHGGGTELGMKDRMNRDDSRLPRHLVAALAAKPVFMPLTVFFTARADRVVRGDLTVARIRGNKHHAS